MKHHDSSRRQFLQLGTAAAGSSWARLVIPGLATLSQAACSARDKMAPFNILTEEEGAEFEAIAARILPTTDTPGAREAGVVYFFDQTFGTFNAQMLPAARGGLQQFQAGIDGGPFSALTETQQDAYLEANQESRFFGMMRMLTLCGFFGMSKYGGNFDGIGWQLVGMDQRIHSYESPFGYYDAEYMKEHPNG